MFAYSYSQYGAPDVLTKVELPTPTPNANEVLIKVVATTVSAGDWRARSMIMPKGMGLAGRLYFGPMGPRKPVLGTELSGVIDGVGDDVTNFKIGDAVIGFPGAAFGAHAEYIVMPAGGKLVLKPANLSFEEAAALPFGGTTAYDFLLNKAQLKAGEKVLINGASGSVGSACVQIAKHFGAHVTGVCSGKNAEMVKALGADHVIDYTVQDFEKEDTLYDMVVDAVGTAPFARTNRALRPGGRMVAISGSTSDMFLGVLKARLNGKRMIGGVASESVNILREVGALAAEGQFQAVIDRCFDFSQMIAAHRHVDTGHKRGNVVVTVAPQTSSARYANAWVQSAEAAHV